MLFADVELARRIEAAETGLIEACARVEGREAFVLPIGSGVAAFAGADSPVTKVAGVGFGAPPTEAELAHVEAEFTRRRAAVQIELSTLAQPGLAERLTRRGYVLAGFENVLGLALEHWSPRRASAEVTVAVSDENELATWLAVVVEAFAVPDTQGVASHEVFDRTTLARALRNMARAGDMVRYLARRNGEPAGGASARFHDGIAQLCGAGTHPTHRRGGVQAALLDHRLLDARRANCNLAVVTTLPGSKSHENVQRRGFELLYTRAILRLLPGG
jgi:GNAT superfamily N-acetyltransferase